MITITPINPSVSEWSNVTFQQSSLTTGSNLLTASYQWVTNSSYDTTSATSSVLVINPVLAAYSGDYYLQYTGSVSGSGDKGASASLSSHLQVNPLITTQPSSSNGGMAILTGWAISVGGEVVSSSIAYTYQWYYKNTIVAGKTSQNYDIPAGKSFDTLQGSYYVVITTASGSTQSSIVQVNVMPPGAEVPGVTQLWDPYRGAFQQTWNPYQGGPGR